MIQDILQAESRNFSSLQLRQWIIDKISISSHFKPISLEMKITWEKNETKNELKFLRLL